MNYTKVNKNSHSDSIEKVYLYVILKCLDDELNWRRRGI